MRWPARGSAALHLFCGAVACGLAASQQCGSSAAAAVAAASAIWVGAAAAATSTPAAGAAPPVLMGFGAAMPATTVANGTRLFEQPNGSAQTCAAACAAVPECIALTWTGEVGRCTG